MKPHITNFKHQKFKILLENNIQKLEKVPPLQKTEVTEKITELKSNKRALEKIYSNYQLKLKELSKLLEDYEKVQHTSRTNLRKMQLWLKCSCSKVMKVFL